jgi:hypothetical protein
MVSESDLGSDSPLYPNYNRPPERRKEKVGGSAGRREGIVEGMSLWRSMRSMGAATVTSIAKKNHYNPCFWTAHWNPAYFGASRQDRARLNARDQHVFVLGVQANKVFGKTVKDVHYDEHLCFAEVTMEAADEFCRRAFPKKYEAFRQTLKAEDYPVYIDFESLFVGIEQRRPYQALLEVIKKNCITCDEHKVQIAHFIIYQRLRSHAIMQAALEAVGQAGGQKFESLLTLKWALSSTDVMLPMVEKLGLARWQLFRLDRDTFPLSDLAVTMRLGSVMVTLSPRLLLEISLGTQELGCRHRNWIEADKLAEFRERTIRNTFREIIFSDRKTLEDWHIDPAFQKRIEVIRTMKDYNSLIEGSACL